MFIRRNRNKQSLQRSLCLLILTVAYFNTYHKARPIMHSLKR